MKINATVISIRNWGEHALKPNTIGNIVGFNDNGSVSICWYYTYPRYSGNATVVLEHPADHYGIVFEEYRK